MTTYKYFSDIESDVVELVFPQPMDNKPFADNFPGVRGFRYDGFSMWVGRAADGRLMPITRKIEYKRAPSLHECNAKCLNGKCKGICECKCGGKNHGRGMFMAKVVSLAAKKHERLTLAAFDSFAHDAERSKQEVRVEVERQARNRF